LRSVNHRTSASQHLTPAIKSSIDVLSPPLHEQPKREEHPENRVLFALFGRVTAVTERAHADRPHCRLDERKFLFFLRHAALGQKS
jgi:hypothetical protein